MGFSISVLNNIRANASDEYQTRIPEATQENISTIGNALQTYTPLYNEFSTALLCKIGKTMIESKLFQNRLARFKSGVIVDAQDVEEIFVEMAQAEGEYDPNGSNPFGRRATVQDRVIYHRQNRRDKYVVTIGDLDFRRVFRSEATLDAYITKKINALFSGANKDEFLVMVNLLATYKNYCNYCVPVMAGDNAGETAKTFVKTLRKAVMDVTLDSSKEFNGAGVETWSTVGDLVLLVHKDVLAEVDVEVLAKAFNIGKTDIQVEIVPMPHFGSRTDIYGLLVDKDFFRVWDTLSHMEPQRNADGLFTNYFYHVQQIVSCSPFKNAIAFTTKELINFTIVDVDTNTSALFTAEKDMSLENWMGSDYAMSSNRSDYGLKDSNGQFIGIGGKLTDGETYTLEKISG